MGSTANERAQAKERLAQIAHDIAMTSLLFDMETVNVRAGMDAMKAVSMEAENVKSFLMAINRIQLDSEHAIALNIAREKRERERNEEAKRLARENPTPSPFSFD